MFCFSLGDVAAGRLSMLRWLTLHPCTWRQHQLNSLSYYYYYFNMTGRWEEDVLRRDPGEFGRGVRDGFDQDTLYTCANVKE